MPYASSVANTVPEGYFFAFGSSVTLIPFTGLPWASVDRMHALQ